MLLQSIGDQTNFGEGINKIANFIKTEIELGESRTGSYNGDKLGVCGGLWFNNGDAFTHICEYQRWKKAMKDSALTYHASEILKAGLKEEKDPNL